MPDTPAGMDAEDAAVALAEAIDAEDAARWRDGPDGREEFGRYRHRMAMQEYGYEWRYPA
jgi:hypothetical protein